MPLAAMGCDPTATGPDLSDLGGARLGQLGYSNDDAIYLAIRANGAISQYETCFIDSDYRATGKGTSTEQRGVPVCIPQVALADNDYGWGLVYGHGRARTAADATSRRGFALSSTDEELEDASDTLRVVTGIVNFGDTGAHDSQIFAIFPSVGGGAV